MLTFYRFIILICVLAAIDFRVASSSGSPNSLSNKDFTISIIGNSITEGYGINNTLAYPALLQKKLRQKIKNTTINVRADGISGSTTSSLPRRVAWQLKQKPNIVILALGGNDALRGIKVDTVRENLNKAIKTIKDAGVIPVVLGMRAPPNYGPKFVSEFDAIFKRIQSSGVPTKLFFIESVAGKPEYNLPDGIHPNEKGHALVAEGIFEFILPVVNKAISQKSGHTND